MSGPTNGLELEDLDPETSPLTIASGTVVGMEGVALTRSSTPEEPKPDISALQADIDTVTAERLRRKQTDEYYREIIAEEYAEQGESYDAAADAAFENAMEAFEEDFQVYSADVEEAEQEFTEVEAQAQESFNIAAEELARLGQERNAKLEELEALKKQSEADPSNEALKAELAAKQQEFNKADELYKANVEAFANLSGDYNTAKEAMDRAKENMRDLREQMRQAQTPEEKEEIRLKMEDARKQLQDARDKMDRLETTARETRELMGMTKDGVLDAAELKRVHELSNNDPMFKMIAANLAEKMIATGVKVEAEGKALEGQAASQYVNAMINVTALDFQRYKLDQAIAADPNNNELKQQLADLDKQRVQLEDQMKMCVIDQAAIQKDLDAASQKGATPAVGISGTAAPIINATMSAEVTAPVAAASITPIITETKTTPPSPETINMTVNNNPDAPAAITVDAVETAAVAAKRFSEGDKLSENSSLDLSMLSFEEQQIREKETIERFTGMVADGAISASQIDELKRIGGDALVQKLLEEEQAKNPDLKIETGVLAEFGFGFLSPAVNASLALGAVTATASVASQVPNFTLFGQTVEVTPIMAPTVNAFAPFGIGPGGYSSFADSPQFAETNPAMSGNTAAPTYMETASFAAGAMALTGLFGQGPAMGPTQAEQARMEAQRIMEWQAEQARQAFLRQQQEQMQMMAGLNGPQYNNTGRQT